VAVDLKKLSAGLSSTWAGYLRDWDRSLRAGNYPETTRYNYLLATAQLARYVADEWVRLDGQAAAEDPTLVTKAQVEEFQIWMVLTRSGATALNKHKGLQQFFKWLLLEGEIERSPMGHLRQPKTTSTLVPIICDADTKKVLDACKGIGFANLRDEAIVRLLYNTGARLAEVTGLQVEDVDLNLDSVHYHGKGARDRRVRFGPRTGRALSRYFRVRAAHQGSELPQLWLAERGGLPLSANGIKLMLRRRGDQACVPDVHAHRWRHSFAHEWKLAGGDTGDLMLLLGWSSEDMPRLYGASAAAERAQEVHARMGIGERV
jgi:site-specific recombinase XerD